jgi:ABC-type dipeptide/oligopeptide/nickel transport system permease subunit
MADFKNYDNLTPEDFKLVQKEDKIYDKKFETKPIGYFKDALIRFGKNRTNVIATTILFFLIGCSILIPVFSKKNVVAIEEQLAFLPPRIPLVEKLGVFNGTKEYEGQIIDLETIDPETGIGYPEGFDHDAIVEGSLENYVEACTIKDERCTGGEAVLRVDPTSNKVSVKSNENFFFVKSNNPVLDVDIFNVDAGAKLNVYVLPTGGEMTLVGSYSSAGTYSIDVFDTIDADTVSSSVYLELEAEDNSKTIAINALTLTDSSQEEPLIHIEGYPLSKYEISGGAGLYVRQNGEFLLTRFVIDEYAVAFAEKLERYFPSSEYEQILTDFADVCVQSPDPENPDGWLFGEGCPITKVEKKIAGINVGGVDYSQYRLYLDYARYNGYDETPFFLFGTTDAGRDLFTLIWVALRTSLLIGFTVAIINIAIGVVYGAVSGYYGGLVDLLLQRVAEVLGRIPWLVTLSIFIALIGPGITTLIFILILNGWIGIANTTRTQFYRYKGREYVLASRTLGAKDGRLIFRHILPNGIGTIITASVLMIPGVIFTESTISYLGYGIGHGQTFRVFGVEFSGVSIGVLLSDGRTELINNPHLVLFPAIVISILMITFNMFGNALRDAFNPALRGSE